MPKERNIRVEFEEPDELDLELLARALLEHVRLTSIEEEAGVAADAPDQEAA